MIELKKLEQADLEYRVLLLNNDEIAPYLNVAEKFTLPKTQKWFSKIENDSTRQDFVFMGKDEKVGMGGLSNISLTDKNCELYMYMDVNFQGKGLGYLCGKKLCEYAFNILKLEKVILYTFANNYRANSLYEKIGFKLEGTLRKQTFKDEKLQDRNIYGLLKNELK